MQNKPLNCEETARVAHPAERLDWLALPLPAWVHEVEAAIRDLGSADDGGEPAAAS